LRNNFTEEGSFFSVMKKFSKLMLVGFTLAGLAGCRDTGYNGKTLNNDLTPNVTPQATTRTYDANGNPVVTPAPVPGASDPTSPNYHGPSGPN
jgi:hypothetical protein